MYAGVHVQGELPNRAAASLASLVTEPEEEAAGSRRKGRTGLRSHTLRQAPPAGRFLGEKLQGPRLC